jgi:hypothetical protein
VVVLLSTELLVEVYEIQSQMEEIQTSSSTEITTTTTTIT